jgi:MSHA biogenesis protein MshQ
MGINTSVYTAYTSGGTVSRLSGLSAAGTWIAGVANVTATARLERSVVPDGPYTSLSIGIAPEDADGVVLLGAELNLDADANGVNDSFSVGTTQERFGRLRLNNTFGSELLDRSLSLSTEYYATNFFTVNALDSCTTLAASDFAFVYVGGFPLVACKTAMNPSATLYFNAGTASAVAPPTAVSAVKLTKPGSGNQGSVDLTINLNGASGNACVAIGGVGPAATNANKAYLQSNWGSGSYTDNPRARATFGIYKNADQFIYLRENF